MSGSLQMKSASWACSTAPWTSTSTCCRSMRTRAGEQADAADEAGASDGASPLNCGFAGSEPGRITAHAKMRGHGQCGQSSGRAGGEAGASDDRSPSPRWPGARGIESTAQRCQARVVALGRATRNHRAQAPLELFAGRGSPRDSSMKTWRATRSEARAHPSARPRPACSRIASKCRSACRRGRCRTASRCPRSAGGCSHG